VTATKIDQKPSRDSNIGSQPRQFSILSVLAWAVAPAAVFGAMLGISCLGSVSSELNLLVLLIFILPAAWIFEALGMGTFNIFANQIPVAMWAIMIMLAYAYALVLVLLARGLWRLLRLASSQPFSAGR
jgi:hypothetical protein